MIDSRERWESQSTFDFNYILTDKNARERQKFNLAIAMQLFVEYETKDAINRQCTLELHMRVNLACKLQTTIVILFFLIEQVQMEINIWSSGAIGIRN